MQRGIAFAAGLLGPLVGEIVVQLVQQCGFSLVERIVNRFSGKDSKR